MIATALARDVRHRFYRIAYRRSAWNRVSDGDEPMFVQDQSAELWCHGAVKCVLVPHGHTVEVELRNADGSPFLRKTAANRQAALNEAEYLRLLLRRPPPPSRNA